MRKSFLFYKVLALILLSVIESGAGQYLSGTHIIREHPHNNLERIEVSVEFSESCSGLALVIVPGLNSSAAEFTENTGFLEFCRRNHIHYVEVTFRGEHIPWGGRLHYSNGATGTAQILFEMLVDIFSRNGYSVEDESLFLVGFSAGARFVSSFVDRYPDVVRAWCAHSSGIWEEPIKGNLAEYPHGIVSAGQLETLSKYRSLHHFQLRRREGQRVTWVSVSDCRHHWSKLLDQFVVGYFQSFIGKERFDASGQYEAFRDIDSGLQVPDFRLQRWPMGASWLPNQNLLRHWLQIHHIEPTSKVIK